MRIRERNAPATTESAAGPWTSRALICVCVMTNEAPADVIATHGRNFQYVYRLIGQKVCVCEINPTNNNIKKINTKWVKRIFILCLFKNVNIFYNFKKSKRIRTVQIKLFEEMIHKELENHLSSINERIFNWQRHLHRQIKFYVIFHYKIMLAKWLIV